MNLNEWSKEAYRLASEKGFHDEDAHTSLREQIAVYTANLHGEASEMWEAYRAGKLHSPCDKAERMVDAGLPPLTCIEEELADILIRVLDTAGALGVDIQRAVETKHAYNKTRPRKHGGKLA